MLILKKLLLFFLCCHIILAGVLAQDTVAYYPFSGNALDASGYNNDACIHGALLSQDRFGLANNAFAFDGQQSYLEAESAPHLQTDFATVSFWVNVTEIPAQGEAYLLTLGSWQERWKISLPSHGKLIWTTNADIISDMDAGDGNELQEGVWTHVAMVHDGAKDLIYIDGVLANEKNVTGNLNATDSPFGIGYNSYEGGSYFNGLLDEVLVFGDALTAQQVADLYLSQSEAPDIPEGVVACYSFSNNLFDETAFANHGVGTDLQSTTDRFGFGSSAYEFNGTTSRIEIDNSTQLNSDNTTVSFWIKLGTLPAQGESYVASFGGWQERWKISLPSHGKLVWTTNHENGISDMDAGDGNELQTGAWTHVVMVHDGAKDKIFMNGALAAEKDVAGALNSTTFPFGLGYNVVDGGNYFSGALDEVKIYNYALTDQEIADLYDEQNSANIVDTSLVADFRFTGSAKDASQFENHGVIQGAVPVKDRFGYGGNAMSFSGAEYIWVPNSVQYNSDYTSVSFWVNVGELPASGENYILSFGGWQERWKISLPSHGKPVWTTNHETGISDMDSGDGNELVPGTWMHVVAVHGADKDKIFVNGTLAAEKDVGGTMNSTNYPLGIGYNPIDNGNFFVGSLDEIQIYNEELTDQQVADLYAAQSTAPVITDSLVAYYPFTGNAYDVTPYHNNGWVNGAQLTNDRFTKANHAYSFDGLSSYISAENSMQLNSPLATVSFWVNVNEFVTQGEAYLLTFGGWQERWKISLPSHGKPVWTTNYENGISDMDSGDGNELVTGEWTHVAVVHDSLKNKIFINGVLANEKDVIGNLNNTDYSLGMGYNIIDGGSYFNGALDEVQIYSVALSDQEIADLYAAQSVAPAEEDTIPPSAPLDLTAMVNFTNVNLSWTGSMDNVGVTAYNVYQDSGKIMTTTQTNASISGLAQLTTYTFGVTAVDLAGNESMTSTLQVTTGVDESPDTIPPSTPQNLMVSTGSTSALFSWDPSTDNQAIAGYVVFVDGVFFDSLAANVTAVFIGGLEPETPYTFEVYAFDLAGNNSELADITVSTQPPVVTQEEGLVAWYPFEGNAEDATPFANHGVIGGNPTFETRMSGRQEDGLAIVFDGDRDSVLAPNAAQLISDYTTVSFWIRVDSIKLSDPESYVLDFGHWDERWKISLPQHRKIVWTTNSKNAQLPNFISDMDAGDGNELVVDFWFYVTMVHDGVNDIIYLDGLEANRKPVAGTLNSTARPFGMGSSPVFAGAYFVGALDEVKVYNKALTAEEILKLAETGTTSIPYVNVDLNKYVRVLYPNPSSDEITIEHQFNGKQPLQIRIFDYSGRQVSSLRFNSADLVSGPLKWDISQFTSGYYSLNFVYGGKNLGSIPFIKQ